MQRMMAVWIPSASVVITLLLKGDFGATALEGDTVAIADVFASDDATPRLVFLGLRCADRPIDIQPPFSSNHHVYKAYLDFSMGNFAIDAIPAKGMTIQNYEALQTTKLISPGESNPIEIRVSDPASAHTSPPYTVTIIRMDGKDVRIRDLTVNAPEFTPLFDRDITEYYVRLAVDHERLHVRFQPWDTGQTFEVKAQLADQQEIREWKQWAQTITTTPLPEQPGPMAGGGGIDPLMTEAQSSSGIVELPDSGVSSTTGAVGTAPKEDTFDPFAHEADSPTRRLSLALDDTSFIIPGETQYSVIERFFPIDVGQSRLIAISVKPANGDLSTSQTYKLQAMRDGCPHHRPFYAPDLGVCAATCNQRYFPHPAANECEKCPSLCLRCAAWDECMECEPSQWRLLHFVIRHDGYCKVAHIPWDYILLATLCSVLGLAVCCCCCSGWTDGVGRREKVTGVAARARRQRRQDWYDTDEAVQSHRLLGINGEPTELDAMHDSS